MNENNTLCMTSGSDLDFTVTWPDENGPADLTGYTVEIYKPHDKLANHITAEITDPVNGLISCRIEWNDEIPVGKIAYFAIRITSGNNNYATSRIWVDVKV